MTLAPVTHAWRCRPSRPEQSSSICGPDSTRVPLAVSTNERYPAHAHELLGLGAAQRARVGDDLLRLGRGVDAVHREPVVVVDALGAVGGRGAAELPAHLQRRRDLLVAQAHERVAEAVRAAVALVARLRVLAEADRDRRAFPSRSPARRR